jgi:hypothetical protein
MLSEYACGERPLADIAQDARAQGHCIQCGPIARNCRFTASGAVNIVENHPRKAPARQSACIFC